MTRRSTNTNSRAQARSTRQRGQPRQEINPAGQYVSDAWSLAKRTALGLNEIRKLINVEHKFIDTNASPNVDLNGSVTYLSSIAQGDNISEREGDSIKVQGFEIMGTISRGTAAASAWSVVRILVIRDLQNAGAAPAASDVLETVGTATAPYQPLDFISGNQLNKRFTVVYDDLYTLDPDDPVVAFKFRSNHDCHTFFRAAASGVASAGNGSYFLVCVSDESVNTPRVSFCSRLTFTDN